MDKEKKRQGRDVDWSKIEPYGGFSHVRIILSDALPPEAFHPDYPDFDPNDPKKIFRLKGEWQKDS